MMLGAKRAVLVSSRPASKSTQWIGETRREGVMMLGAKRAVLVSSRPVSKSTRWIGEIRREGVMMLGAKRAVLAPSAIVILGIGSFRSERVMMPGAKRAVLASTHHRHPWLELNPYGRGHDAGSEASSTARIENGGVWRKKPHSALQVPVKPAGKLSFRQPITFIERNGENRQAKTASVKPMHYSAAKSDFAPRYFLSTIQTKAPILHSEGALLRQKQDSQPQPYPQSGSRRKRAGTQSFYY